MILSTQPSVFLFGIEVSEPVTTVTDLMVAAICFYAFVQLRGLSSGNAAQRHMAQYFLFLGLGTSLGGLLAHGFHHLFSIYWRIPGWLLSIVGIYFLMLAVLRYGFELLHRQYHLAKVGAKVLAGIFTLLLLWQLTVLPVVAFTGVVLLVVIVPINGLLYWQRKDRASVWMLLGVVSTLLAATAFLGPIDIDKWFNHVDLSHIFMAASAYLFYLGALGMADKAPVSEA